MIIFGRKCFIKRNDDKIGKFEPIANEWFLLGYSSKTKGYKCYNRSLQNIIESIGVVVDEGYASIKRQIQSDDEQILTKIQEVEGEEEGEALKEENEIVCVTKMTPSRYV